MPAGSLGSSAPPSDPANNSCSCYSHNMSQSSTRTARPHADPSSHGLEAADNASDPVIECIPPDVNADFKSRMLLRMLRLVVTSTSRRKVQRFFACVIMCTAVVRIFKTKNLIIFLPSHGGGRARAVHHITSTMPNDCFSSGINQIAPSWCLDTSGTARFIGASSNNGVRLTKNGTVAEKKYRNRLGFEKCLANKHIVLIGDSRVRYQYMMLAYFLKTGQWMKCQDYNSLPVNYTFSPGCYIIDERGHVWNDWYRNSNELLQQNTTQQELCDCSRDKIFNPDTTTENRYLRRHTPFGLVQVTYLQNFKDQVKFHAEFPPFSEFSTTNRTDNDVHRCDPGLCSHPYTNVSDTKTTLLEVVPMLRPTHVFANTGWNHNLHDAQFGCVLDLFRSQNPSIEAAFVITHPMTKNKKKKGDSLPEQGCNSSVFDRMTSTSGLPRSWFWDSMHLLSIANQEFNHMMLDKICGGLDLQV
jgi:hypothetical protein